MRLYSDTLRESDIREAARTAGVYLWTCDRIGRPRVRQHGWVVYLSGSSSYRSQATGEKAATWDEHGVWMAELYKVDPKLRVSLYRDLDHFLSWTREYRDSWHNQNQPDSKRQRAPWLDDPALVGGGVTMGTLTPSGLVNVRTIRQADIAACPFVIFVPDHYREDGSCKCDDSEERARMISEWDYAADDFASIPLRVA